MEQTTKKNQKKLSSTDIDELLSEGVKFKKLDSVLVAGKEWDLQSFWAFVISIIS